MLTYASWRDRTDGKGGKDEIFVDVVERLTCTFNATGNITQAQARAAASCCTSPPSCMVPCPAPAAA